MSARIRFTSPPRLSRWCVASEESDRVEAAFDVTLTQFEVRALASESISRRPRGQPAPVLVIPSATRPWSTHS